MAFKIAASLLGTGVDPCCCGTACCMYPYPYDPTGTTELYPATDLPDSIVFTPGFDNFDEGIPVTLTRTGYHFSGTGPSGHVHTINAETSPYQSWTNWDEITGLVLSCLITGDGNLTPGDDMVEDQFEGTYFSRLFGDTQSYMRQSLCVWEEDYYIAEERKTIQYIETGTPFDKPQWCINAAPYDDNSRYWKEDPQSSPEGDYIGDVDSAVITITTT